MKRGWIENSHFESQCFHLKFSLRSKDIVWESLVHYQVVNHFQKSTNITTKLGLLKTLENSMWHCSIDKDDYFPRCFDVGNSKDFEDFVEYYRLLNVENFIKKFVLYLDCNQFDRKSDAYKSSYNKLDVALKVIRRKLMGLCEFLKGNYPQKDVTNQEWQYFSREESIEKDSLLIELEKDQTWPKIDKSLYQGEIPKLETEAREVLAQLHKECPQTSINGHRNIWI